jgi:hypothetical protein
MPVIRRNESIEYYNLLVSYQTTKLAKLPSLDEFLGVAFNEKGEEPKGFDEKTDKVLEAEAMKRLEEKRKQRGQ